MAPSCLLDQARRCKSRRRGASSCSSRIASTSSCSCKDGFVGQGYSQEKASFLRFNESRRRPTFLRPNKKKWIFCPLPKKKRRKKKRHARNPFILFSLHHEPILSWEEEDMGTVVDGRRRRTGAVSDSDRSRAG